MAARAEPNMRADVVHLQEQSRAGDSVADAVELTFPQ
jgi:hypothetical protein